MESAGGLTKFTFPMLISDSADLLNRLTDSYLKMSQLGLSSSASGALWLDVPYTERELHNLSPYVKQFLAILVIEICPDERDIDKISVSWIEDINSAVASIGRGESLVRSDVVHENPRKANSPSCTLSSFAGGLFAYEPAVDTFLPTFGALLLDLDDGHVHLRGQDLADVFERFAAEHLTVLRKTLPSNNATRMWRRWRGGVNLR